MRPHFIDRWKKNQKKEENDEDDELDKIDPFFDDIFAGLSDDDLGIEEEQSRKQSAQDKRSTIKKVPETLCFC